MHRLLDIPPVADSKSIVVIVSNFVVNNKEDRHTAMFSGREDGRHYYLRLKRMIKNSTVVQAWNRQGTCKFQAKKNKKGRPAFEHVIIRDTSSDGANRIELEFKEIILERTY